MENLFLTPVEVASRLRLAPRTLANWRSQNKGPTHTKIGGRVLYAASELDSFLSCTLLHPVSRPNIPQEKSPQISDDAFLKFVNGLSRRAQTVVRNREIRSFEHLRSLRPDDLRRIPNCGARTIEEIFAGARAQELDATSRPPGLEEEVQRLVEIYGLKRVLSSVAKLMPS